MPENKINIAITGPESTGKTTLAKALAKQLAGLYIPEFARSFLEERKGIYGKNDLLRIAKGQSDLISEGLNSNVQLVICDTDMTVIQIWHQVKFGAIPNNLQEIIDKHTHDLYLLCYPDIAWEPDELRESPNDRMALFQMYESHLQSIGVEYHIVKGLEEQRTQQAEAYIKDFIQKQKPVI